MVELVWHTLLNTTITVNIDDFTEAVDLEGSLEGEDTTLSKLLGKQVAGSCT